VVVEDHLTFIALRADPGIEIRKHCDAAIKLLRIGKKDCEFAGMNLLLTNYQHRIVEIRTRLINCGVWAASFEC
jgi:hypothetical protein